jgi:TetR/AcrR family transcriptional regulator
MARSRSNQAPMSAADRPSTAKRVKRAPEEAAPVREEEPTPPKMRLLKAATFEFAERGFAGARIDEIARRAKLNKQLIYHYYGGKQQLYAAVLTDMVRHLQTDGVGWLGQDRDPGRNLDLQLRLLETVRKNSIGRQWVRLLMFEALEADDTIHLEDARRRVYEGGVRVVEAAQKRGEIDPAFDAKMLRMALFGLALVPSLLPQIVQLITGMDQRSPEFAEQWGKLLEDLYSRLSPRESA